MPVPGLIPYPRIGERTISFLTDTDNVDLWPAVGSPTEAVTVTVYIENGVTIGSALFPGSSAPSPALWIRNFAAGSRVIVVNRGTIAGGGGIGGGGDRGRRLPNPDATGFIGGGGGGGAGSSSQGGAKAVEATPNSATDGSAGTSTTGGAAGVNDTGGPDGGLVQGAAAQFGGPGIVCQNADLVIDNLGTIAAGANGGEGGYRADVNIDPEAGDDLALSATFVTLFGNEPSAVFHSNSPTGSGYTLTWLSGDTYPDVIGYVREIA